MSSDTVHVRSERWRIKATIPKQKRFESAWDEPAGFEAQVRHLEKMGAFARVRWGWPEAKSIKNIVPITLAVLKASISLTNALPDDFSRNKNNVVL